MNTPQIAHHASLITALIVIACSMYLASKFWHLKRANTDSVLTILLSFSYILLIEQDLNIVMSDNAIMMFRGLYALTLIGLVYSQVIRLIEITDTQQSPEYESFVSMAVRKRKGA